MSGTGRAYSRETARALHGVKCAKAAVSQFLGPANQSSGCSPSFDNAVAELQTACERFRAALAADIERQF
ncbi:hypothetical protein [Candidatus Burkholderia verschuerenii]|uniref:hypothetical protein n=1 Tax=Candidatus Burkholderia verschuerenii TaxID=242163 RepID=UPI00067BB287|nr:hypothetical protein [Candidatus Burkholderia verschuerenii]